MPHLNVCATRPNSIFLFIYKEIDASLLFSCHGDNGGSFAEKSPMSAPNTPAKMLMRNLAAVVYDLLILPAILFIAVIPTVFIQDGEPFQQGWPRWLLQLWLLLVAFVFLGHSWVRGGQTIGMRAWRIRLVSDDGQPIRWSQAGRRFLAGLLNLALAGLGFLLLLRPPYRSLHDRLSGTHLVYLPKESKKPS